MIQFGQRQRLHRRVTEPNKLDECSLTLHHLSDDCFDDESLRDIDGRPGDKTDGNNGVRNGSEIDEDDGEGELELDELEFNEFDDECVGDVADESRAANACE